MHELGELGEEEDTLFDDFDVGLLEELLLEDGVQLVDEGVLFLECEFAG